MTRSVARAVVAAVIAVAALSPAGCASAGSAPRPSASGKVGAARPGLTDIAGGRAVATGWLTEVAIAGGQWQLVSEPPESSLGASVVAVLVPGEVAASRLDDLRGTFIGAEGVRSPETTSTGAPSDVRSPVIAVDAIRAY